MTFVLLCLYYVYWSIVEKVTASDGHRWTVVYVDGTLSEEAGGGGEMEQGREERREGGKREGGREVRGKEGGRYRKIARERERETCIGEGPMCYTPHWNPVLLCQS